MPRFYFHLSNHDECLRDDIGYDLVDLAAAHIRAQDLARRVMRASCLADRKPDWRACTVTVTNDSQGPTLTLMFSSLVGTDLPNIGKVARTPALL